MPEEIAREYVDIPTETGHLACACHHDERLGNMRKGVLLLHSKGGCKLGPCSMFIHLADELSSHGFLCARIDHGGNGESYGGGGDEAMAAADAEAAIKSLAERYRVDQWAIVTISDSASVALRLRCEVLNIKQVVLMSPVFRELQRGRASSSAALSITIGVYLRKLCDLNTYRRAIRGDISVSAVGHVLRSKVAAVCENTSRKKKYHERFRSAAGVLLIGQDDPHCIKNIETLRHFIRQQHLPWRIEIVKRSGHNFAHPEERRRVLSHILCVVQAMR